MRYFNSSITEKIASRIQTPANNSQPSLSAWLTRNDIMLVNGKHLESQQVATNASITGADIAVRHPFFGRQSTQIFIGYVGDGIARVISSPFQISTGSHVWLEENFSESNAVDIAVAFDGYMPQKEKGKTEFITQGEPWIFWCSSTGSLYAWQLGSEEEPVILSARNCTKVTAVRATYDEELYDFGLVVFFLTEGELYYAQRIKGVWYDPVVVGICVPNVMWIDIAAERTADYRVVVQALGDDGNIYDIFSKFQGIGRFTSEHIEITGVEASAVLTLTRHINAFNTEYIEVGSVDVSHNLLYASSSRVTNIQNIDDGNGNWGIYVVVEFNYPIHNVNAGDIASFSLQDSNDNVYGVEGLSLSNDGLTLTLQVQDFNFAGNATDMTLIYTPGYILSPAHQLDALSETFIPVNLVPPQIDPPEVTSIYNF